MTPREKRFWTGAALVSAELLGTMVAFTGALALLVFAIRPYMRKHKKIDLKIFDELKMHVSEPNNPLMRNITFLGSHQFLIPANLALITYFLFIRKRTWFSIRVASVALSSVILMSTLKKIFRRKRPLLPLLQPARGLSFPSGHAMMSITFYGLLMYIISHTIKNQPLKRTYIMALAVLIAGIGFSRIYLRVHYTSDVLAGNIIGLLWLVVALDVLSRLETYNKQKAKELTRTVAVTV
jgi:membrane-associated phospholipid phosphatase